MSDETEIRKIADELMTAAISVGVNAFAGLIPKDEIKIRHEVNLDHFMDQIRDFLPSHQQPDATPDTMPVALTELEWACNITDSNGGEDILVSYVRPRLAALRTLFTEAPQPAATPDTLEKSGPCETCGEPTTTCWHWGAWQHIDCHFGEPSPVKESLTTGPQAETPKDVENDGENEYLEMLVKACAELKRRNGNIENSQLQCWYSVFPASNKKEQGE